MRGAVDSVTIRRPGSVSRDTKGHTTTGTPTDTVVARAHVAIQQFSQQVRGDQDHETIHIWVRVPAATDVTADDSVVVPVGRHGLEGTYEVTSLRPTRRETRLLCRRTEL